jgi:ribosomal protein S5
MKARILTLLVGLAALPLAAAAETWKDVPVVDTNCLSKVKADPDKHTTQCALQCAKGGYGLIAADGAYLKFDAAGNEKTVTALKATKKTDHLRAVVVGERDGETIKVSSVSID